MASDLLDRILQELRTGDVCNCTLLVVTWVAFLARMYTRVFISRRFARDDQAMCAAQLLYTVARILSLMDNNQGFRAIKGFPVNAQFATQLARAGNFFYAVTVVAVKISIGFFFLHLFNLNQRFQRGLIWTLMGLSTTIGLVWAIMTEATCGIRIGSGSCAIQRGFNAVSITWSVINAVSDAAFVMIAFQALWAHHLKLYVKVSAMLLLLLACVGGALSVVRIYYNAGGEGQENFLLFELQLSRWSCIESGIYITTACLATLRPLTQQIMARLTGKAYDQGGYGNAMHMQQIDILDELKAPKTDKVMSGQLMTIAEIRVDVGTSEQV